MYEYTSRIVDGVETFNITIKNPLVNVTDEKDINGFTKVLLIDDDNINVESNILKFYLSKWFPKNKITSFINLLNNNFVITGSSILKMIHTFESENSDLDLAIYEDVDIEDFLYLLHDTGFEKDISYYSNIPGDSEYINDMSLKNNIKEIHKYYKDNKGIDVIILNTTPYNYIKSFDLKIVMSYFNGNGFYLLHPENVIGKKETLKHIPNDYKHYMRIEKYIERGFDISIFNVDVKKLIFNDPYYPYCIYTVDLLIEKMARLVIKDIIYNNRKRKEFKENLLKYAMIESERYMDPDSQYIKYYFNDYFKMKDTNDRCKIVYLTSDDKIKLFKF